MINYFCCALKVFEGAKFFFIIWPFCVIKSKAMQTWYCFFFNKVWYFSKALLDAYICYLPAWNHQHLGEGWKNRLCFAAEYRVIIFVLYCLNSSWQKISLVPFLQTLGTSNCCCIEQRTPPREISTSVFESWAETAQENSSLEPVAFSLLSVPKTLLLSVRKYRFLWRWFYAVPLTSFNKSFSEAKICK